MKKIKTSKKTKTKINKIVFIYLTTNDNIPVFVEMNKKKPTQFVFCANKHQKHKISFIHLIIHVTR